MKYAPGHALAGANGYVSEARWVLYERVGPGSHPCHWCGTPVDWIVGKRGNMPGAVIADHLDDDPLNDDPDNLVVSCGGCNGTRARWVGDDEAFRTRPTGTRLRGVSRVCGSCGSEFVAWDTDRGRGRFCSRSCARRAPRGAG